MTGAPGNPAPRMLPDAAGAFTLDAAMLAERFGWSEQALREMMQRGLVSSLVERGEGEDSGRWRLSVRCGNRRWQAVIEADGTMADQHLTIVPPQRTGVAARRR